MSGFFLALAMLAAQPAPTSAPTSSPVPSAAEDLAFTSWAIIEINGVAVAPANYAYSLDLGENGFLGYSRCNRFSGRFASAEGRLDLGLIGATENPCPPPHDRLDAQLRRVLSGAAGPVRVSLPDADTMLLTADIAIRLRRKPGGS
ncbi:MAG TPA: META domain-containing protein [Allosphingosinicella sp.]|nr:META domain-containing protein [Allosphingosinicella sp.]